MRSAGNFHPEWGYLAPAPSFLRTLRVVVVATAIGATAGAAVVISLVERPTAGGADRSIAARALVTVAPATVAASNSAMVQRVTAPVHKPVVALAPVNESKAVMAAAAAAPLRPRTTAVNGPAMPAVGGPADTIAAAAPRSTPIAKPQSTPSVAALTVPEAMTESAPTSMHDATAIAPEATPAKKAVRHRYVRNEPIRRWRSESEARERWRHDGGFGPLLHLFSFRSGSLFDSN